MAKVLRITAKRPGFRRAGIAHPATPVDRPIGDLTAAQIKALKAEPMLVVQELDAEAKGDGKPGQNGGGK